MLAGAVGGIFQGINQTMADRRAASLKEIEMQYRTAEREADRKFRSEERAADQEFRTELEDTRFANNITVAEKTDELSRAPKAFDWNDKSLMSTYSNVAEAKAADDPTMLEPRTKAGDGTAALQNVAWYANASEAERSIYDRVNKISESASGMTPENQQKAILDLYAAFEKKDGYDKTASLKSLGIDPKLQGQALRDAVIGAYSGTVQQIVGAPAAKTPGSTIPLVEEEPAVTAAPAVTGTPGSSQDNPADAANFPQRPPSGTWVRLSNGNVVQIP